VLINGATAFISTSTQKARDLRSSAENDHLVAARTACPVRPTEKRLAPGLGARPAPLQREHATSDAAVDSKFGDTGAERIFAG
jgi:hypothetical protein